MRLRDHAAQQSLSHQIQQTNVFDHLFPDQNQKPHFIKLKNVSIYCRDNNTKTIKSQVPETIDSRRPPTEDTMDTDNSHKGEHMAYLNSDALYKAAPIQGCADTVLREVIQHAGRWNSISIMVSSQITESIQRDTTVGHHLLHRTSIFNPLFFILLTCSFLLILCICSKFQQNVNTTDAMTPTLT